MKEYKSGQALIITIMMLATMITVVMAISFKSTTDTQITKLEEESQKALAAAEAAVDAALQQQISGGAETTFTLSELGLGAGITSNYTGTATVITTSNKQTFVTRLLQKDESYTFYSGDYNKDTNVFSNPWTGDLTIYLKSGSACPSVEVIQIKTDNSIVKNIIDPCDNFSTINGGELGTSSGGTIEGTAFTYKSTPITISATAPAVANKLIIVRALFASTKIGFQSDSSTRPLRAQGKTVESEAQSISTGVTKQVELLQTFPQIPADFFTTRF